MRIACSLGSLLSEQEIVEKSCKNDSFWKNVTKYASSSDDESFVEELKVQKLNCL